MGALCHFGLHRRRWVAFEGADHTGVDVYLRCTNCDLRAERYIECAEVTPKVREMLRDEWDRSTTREEIPAR